MVSADLRFELLCQGISSALLVPLSNAAELVEDRHVCNFVTDNACMLLLVSYDVIKKSWSTSTTIDPMINAEQDRIFVAAIKSKFSPLTASNLNESIRLHTVRSANPCQDLYYILRDIFNPILQRFIFWWLIYFDGGYALGVIGLKLTKTPGGMRQRWRRFCHLRFRAWKHAVVSATLP